MAMRRLTSDEFLELLEEYSNYAVPPENTRLELVDLLSDKETLFAEVPSYVIAYMDSEYNDEGGAYSILESFAVFNKDGEEISDDRFSRNDKWLQAEDIVRELVSELVDFDEFVIPLETNWFKKELYIDE